MMRVVIIVGLLFMWSSAQPLAQEDLSYGTNLVAKEQYSEAEAYFKAAFERNPNDSNVSASLAKLYLAQRDPKTAVKWAERATDLEPDNLDWWLLLATTNRFLLDDAGFFSQLKFAKRIRSALETAVELEPQNVEAHYRLAEYYIKSPSFLGGGLEKADKEIKTLQEVAPARAMHARGLKAVVRMKDSALQEEHLRAAVELDETSESLYILATVLRDMDRYDEAASTAMRAIAEYPEDVRNYYILGRASVETASRISEAISALQHYVTTPHQDWDGWPPYSYKSAHYLLGRLYEMNGDEDRAAKQYKRALEYDPEYTIAKDALAKTGTFE